MIIIIMIIIIVIISNFISYVATKKTIVFQKFSFFFRLKGIVHVK